MLSLQQQVLDLLIAWGTDLTAQVLPGPPDGLDIPWSTLPLRRSRSSAEGIIYTAAVFPWLNSLSPPSLASKWEPTTIAFLPQWMTGANSLLTSTIEGYGFQVIPGFGLAVQVSAEVLGNHLQGWMDQVWIQPTEFHPELTALRPALLAKTGEGWALKYSHDRCEHLTQLARRQGWWSREQPFPWRIGLKYILAKDPTARSLLEIWLDNSYAFRANPQRLVSGVPRLLNAFEQFDRAHALGGLFAAAQRSPEIETLPCYGGLIGATQVLLRDFQQTLNPPHPSH